MQDLLTTGEAAKRLGVPAPTLQRWARKGLIPTVKTLGGRYRYRPADLDAAAEQMGLAS